MQRKTKLRMALVAGAGAVLGFSSLGHAQSADALIDKLVQKGILTSNEAKELRQEADKDFDRAYSVKTGMPEWVNSMKFNGDFRGRFEGFYSPNDAYTDRNRWRYRLRYGVTVSMLDAFEVGFRLGSGDIDSYPSAGIDPISNNQSMQNNGSKKGIFIDLAYAKWAPWNNAAGSGSFTFGKMENPFVFTDMVFDHDYTPEGFAAQAALHLHEHHAAKLNAGAFILDEIGGSTDDPYLFGGQFLVDSAWSPKLTSSAGIGVLAITSPERLSNTAVPNISVGNYREANGSPTYDFVPVIADLSLTYMFNSAPLYDGPFPVRIAGEYMFNTGAPSSSDNYGWNAGITLGKSGKRKTWELSYTYKWFGANAWWEELPDSDYGAYWKAPEINSGKTTADYYSGTDVRGHIVKLAYSPFNFLTLSAKWFYTDLISDSQMANPPQGTTRINRVQVDAMLKF